MSISRLIRALKIVRRHAYMAELHSLGIPNGVARELLGVKLNIWNADIRETGLKFPYASKKRVDASRRAEIQEWVRRRRNGETLQSIADGVGLTRERVRQLTAPYLAIPAPAEAENAA